MKCFRLLVLFFISSALSAQELKQPKLVVGIVVDQMRPDYLYRFYNRYGADGFKRMMNDGFVCGNTFIPYTPTYTAPGHTCIYTGSVPALHGIVGNNWYDKEKRKNVYCTDDSSVTSVGSTSAAGKMSPRNMWATSIADELRLSTNFRSKTIGIALKDRGSILPAGHSANAAYWFDNASGGWITSTYYMQALPTWLMQLNAKNLPDAYLAKSWNTLYPIETYVQSTADAKSYEGILPGEDETFPHRTDNLKNNKYESFRVTPYGNTYTIDAAKAAIEGEALGSRGVTDLLAVSFSSPDYIGHAFGPNSIEVEDTYLRLDKDLSDFFTYLDNKIGKGQYLVFLTADHAVAHVPGFAKENKIPAATTSSSSLRRSLNDTLQKEFGTGNYILSVINYQVHLNNDLIQANKLDRTAIKKAIIKTLMTQPGVMRAVDFENLTDAALPQPVYTMLANGYNQKLSGEVQFIYKPGWFDGGESGTTHGSWNPYDSHIPLLWYGWGIKKGKTNREIYMTDIAPTLAALLQIQLPNASIGKVIGEVSGQ
ncbi:MAG: alkaline phosphatase family protein [Flavisolibacter sp.]|nr:alkaline phosphatase family protein [Flavisolibacter sp.]